MSCIQTKMRNVISRNEEGKRIRQAFDKLRSYMSFKSWSTDILSFFPNIFELAILEPNGLRIEALYVCKYISLST